MSSIGYIKNKKNIYYLTFNNITDSQSICNYLHISFEEFIDTIQSCNAQYNSRWGWHFRSEKDINKCVIMLTLMKK